MFLSVIRKCSDPNPRRFAPRIGAREGRDHAALHDGDNEAIVGAVPTGIGPPQSRFSFKIAVEAE